MIYLILLLNLVFSWFNAWSIGKSWIEAKSAGGWPKILVWSGAIMSASGFTWSYLIILSLIAHTFGHVSQKYTDVVLQLGYIVLILPIVGSGLAITAQSWSYFWREKTFTNAGFAGWNTFAQVYNMYEAAHTLPEIVKNLAGTLDDRDEDSAPLLALAAVFILAALFGGILTTIAIVRHTMRNHAGDVYVKYEMKRT